MNWTKWQGLLLVSLLNTTTAAAKEPWSHIEYGAANVQSGATRLTPDQVPNLDQLFRRLDALVARNGETPGIFYVNDLEFAATGRAANRLYLYAKERGYQVQIFSLPGDFMTLDLPVTDTATLAHPDGDFFRAQANSMPALRRLASYSRTGLELITSQVAAEGLVFEKDVDRTGESPPYINPKGQPVRKPAAVYRIRAPHVSKGSLLGVYACPVVLSKLNTPRKRALPNP